MKNSNNSSTKNFKKGFTSVNQNSEGFTLVELLVVMAILGVLVTIIAVSFRTSQERGRDSERKSNLRQIVNAMELYYSDYGKYPDETSGKIMACPYNPASGGTVCEWGEGSFTDGNTIYFKDLPRDPLPTYSYLYRVVDSPSNQKFQLFARLENSEDQDCLDNDCATPPVNYDCGTKICNFAITSPNTNATE